MGPLRCWEPQSQHCEAASRCCNGGVHSNVRCQLACAIVRQAESRTAIEAIPSEPGNTEELRNQTGTENQHPNLLSPSNPCFLGGTKKLKVWWPGDPQRELGRVARIDSQKNPCFHHLRAIFMRIASNLRFAIFSPPPLPSAIRKKGSVRETIPENQGSGNEKGVITITGGISRISKISRFSRISRDYGRFLLHFPQSGGSLKSLESLNSLESLENGRFWKDPFSKRPLFPNWKGESQKIEKRGNPKSKDNFKEEGRGTRNGYEASKGSKGISDL